MTLNIKFFLFTLTLLTSFFDVMAKPPVRSVAQTSVQPPKSELPSLIDTNARKKDLLVIFQRLHISGQEAVVRLILAETMASHCEAVDEGKMAPIEAIMKGIAKVIRNRVVNRSEDRELAVVFAQNQFNSSVAQYSCSEISGFLNPGIFEGRIPGIKAGELWQMAQRAYESAWSEKIFDQKSDAVKNYYLHQHSRRGHCNFKSPPWVSEANEIVLMVDKDVGSKDLVQSVRKCIGFYVLNH